MNVSRLTKYLSLQQLGTLGLRSVVLTIVVIALLNVGLVLVISQTSSNFDRSLIAPPLVRQASASAELLENLDSEDRKLALAAINSQSLRLTINPDFAATPPVTNPTEAFVPIIAIYKAVLGDRPFSVYKRNQQRSWLGWNATLADDLIIVMQLSDGSALIVESGSDFRRLVGLYGIAVIVGFLSLVLIGLMIWASVTYARPLSRLAKASQNFVDAVNSAAPLELLPETGPKPVRELAVALNTTGSKLVRLTLERTNTLAAVAHDLRTYLTRLRMRSELIEDETQREKSIRDIEDMSELVEDTLCLGRAVAKPPTLECIDLADWLREFVTHRRDAGDPIDLKMSQTAPVVDVAPRELTRVLNNLTDNALRFGGSAIIAVNDSQSSEVHISVLDDGPGVPDAFLDRMSAPFTRLEGSRSRETGGAGLGLAIAKALAEQMGGTLSLTNRDAGGFCARITLQMSDPAKDVRR